MKRGESVESLLTVKEVAETLKVTERTVYNLIERGDIPRVKVGRAVRIRREDMKDYIERQSERGVGKKSD